VSAELGGLALAIGMAVAAGPVGGFAGHADDDAGLGRDLPRGYLPAFSLTVALGLRYLGVLLMGSLIINPAATAKHVTRSLAAMLAAAAAIAVASTVAGALVARWLQRESGPVIIVLAAAVFFAGLLVRRR
jgi:hypothetical protein